jgi:hypothetical protein
MPATDVLGKTFKVGQMVARAVNPSPMTCTVEVQIVTKIDGDKVYLNSSRQPMKIPKRLAILAQ